MECERLRFICTLALYSGFVLCASSCAAEFFRQWFASGSIAAQLSKQLSGYCI